MAFNFEMVPGADMTPALRSATAPSARLCRVSDDRFPRMTPFLPWKRFDFGTGIVYVLGTDYLHGLLADDIELPLSVLPAEPAYGWSELRYLLPTYQRALSQAAVAGLSDEPKETTAVFLAEYRSACEKLTHWPSVLATEIEFAPPTDFTQPNTAPYSYLACLVGLSIQSLRCAETSRPQGWGFLVFSATPVWQPVDKFGPDQAFQSIGSRWYSRMQADQFAGTVPAVRLSALTADALIVLRRAVGLLPFFIMHEASVDREREFVTLLNMGGLAEAPRKAAFKGKLVDIVAVDERASGCRQLMGRTSDVSKVCSWYLQLGVALCPGEDICSLVGVYEIEKKLAEPRLDFLKLPQGVQMSDEERVAYVIKMRQQHSLVNNKGMELGGEAVQKAGDAVPQMSNRLKAARLEKLHLLTRHQRAVFEIVAVVKDPNATKMQKREIIFSQAIGAFNRHMLGAEVMTGLQLYEDIMDLRCTPGADGDVDRIMGHFMGQQLVKDTQGQVPPELKHFTLEGTGVVDKFLKAKLDTLNMENEILSRITCAKSNMKDSHVFDRDRYLDYVKVDRLLHEVSPLFKAFGLGGVTDPQSFAAIMVETKASLLQVQGLAKCDQEDLLHGDRFGVQSYVLKALKAANSTVRILFCDKDPLTLTEQGRLLPVDDQQFNYELAEGRKAVKQRKRDQITFGSSYHNRTVTSPVVSPDVLQMQKDMNKLKSEAAVCGLACFLIAAVQMSCLR